MAKLYEIRNKFINATTVIRSKTFAKLITFLANLFDDKKPLFVVEVEREDYPFKVESDAGEYGYFKTYADALEFLDYELIPRKHGVGGASNNYYVYQQLLHRNE